MCVCVCVCMCIKTALVGTSVTRKSDAISLHLAEMFNDHFHVTGHCYARVTMQRKHTFTLHSSINPPDFLQGVFLRPRPASHQFPLPIIAHHSLPLPANTLPCDSRTHNAAGQVDQAAEGPAPSGYLQRRVLCIHIPLSAGCIVHAVAEPLVSFSRCVS